MLILIFVSQAISLVLRLSHRASRVFKAFSDDEVIKVLSALMILGQHDEELLAAMEKHLPGAVYLYSWAGENLSVSLNGVHSSRLVCFF